MSRVISVLILSILLSLTINVKGQFHLSLGLEGALTQRGFENVASAGVGVTLGAEIGISNKSGFTVQTGYIHLIPEEGYSSTHLIPYIAGLKMYFNTKENGAYFHPHVGAHTISLTRKGIVTYSYSTPEQTASTTDISYGLGIGFITREKLDIEVRYNLIARNSGTINYLALRVAYFLF